MPLLDKLEKKFGRLAIPNLTLLLIFGQIVVYILLQSEAQLAEQIVLVPALVYRGELWRLLTFLFVPPVENLFFAAITWYFFYLLGSALEGHWGDFRYTLYLLIGWAATLTLAMCSPFVFPHMAAAVFSNAFLAGSVFLAFAKLNPDFQVLLFFILPVKIKWLAALTWVGYLLTLIAGSWAARLAVLASVVNFLLFFGRDIRIALRFGHRTMAKSAKQFRDSQKAIHCCRVCGATEKTHPNLEFRYCSKCSQKACYCMEHLQKHEHV